VNPTEHNANTASTAKTGFFALLGALLHIPGISAPNPTHTYPRSVHGQGGRELNQTGDQDLTDRAMSGRQANFARPCLARGGVAGITTLLVSVMALVSFAAALPASASAEATPAAENVYSAAPGLPDGRVYEQVSPANKNGNQAGATTTQLGGIPGSLHYALAAAGGDSVLFEGTGAFGSAASAESQYFVATKRQGEAGWETRAVLPRTEQSIAEAETVDAKPQAVDPSPDLSHAMIEAGEKVSLAPQPGHEKCYAQIYLTGPDPFLAATWLESPMTANPVMYCDENEGDNGVPVGGTPDFSTVYFVYPGTLLPEDTERAPHAGSGNEVTQSEAWGFYEDREGALREAGVLPADSPYPGGLDPFGAVPAASGRGRAFAGNEVSADGSRVFFVSPDPGSCEQVIYYSHGTEVHGQNNCAVDPPELYVREDGERTTLVSRDTLLPAVDGLSAPAPGGALEMLNPRGQGGFNVKASAGSYVFASPDGSQAFFQSTEDLTEAARIASPGTEAKTYDFDLDTGTLTYLPNVVGQIVATDTDGSALTFVRPAVGTSPAELELWSAGPAGGSVTAITQFPGAGVEPVQISSDGSVVVFSAGGLPGFNDAGATEIFRYDATSNTLACVSCAPAAVRSRNASMSPLRHAEALNSTFGAGMVEERGVSADGARVFFQTQAPLVPQDTNTGTTVPVNEESLEEGEQGMDVYEWENGVVYLISSGKSARNSFFLDSSENGDDVFFATAEGLVPGDTDGAYDVYDARVPHPGDNPPASAVPCEGAVCQGPPNVPSPLTPPASATFSGLGNPAPEVTPPPAKKVTTKTVKCKKGFTKKKNKCVKNKTKKKANTKRGAKR
jgi:hypothetical protein